MGSRRGAFAFSSGPAGTRGLLLFPSEGRVIAMEQTVNGNGWRISSIEKAISEVLCSPYPTAEPDILPSTERAGAAEGTGSPAAGSIPVLSSRPTATAVLYIDFDGELVSDPHWNGGRSIEAKPAVLSAAEIVEIWKRVSEDYVGFDVDITTDVARYNAAATGRRMRCIVTPTDIAARGAGGVAYLNSFSEAGRSFSATIPCWVFNTGVVGAAEAISHEFGHTLGLRHDGRTSPSEEYYQGHGEGALSWAPIMGVGYYKNVVQWSKGEYAAANNHEDDVAVIASTVNGFGFSVDQAGDDLETAAGFVAGALGETNFPGVIQSAGDKDLFRFDAPAGVMRLAAAPAELSPNLDIRLELRDATDQVLVASNPEIGLSAELEFTLPETGRYYLAVVGVGHGNAASDGYSNYGSAGAYAISGEIPVGDGRPVFPTDVTVTSARTIAFSHRIRAGNTPTAYEVTGLPAGLTLDSATGVISGIPTAAEGSYSVSVTGTNAWGSGTGSFVITLSAQPGPTISGPAMILARLNQPMELPIEATGLPDAYAATDLPDGLTIDAATGRIAGTPAVAGVYHVTVTATNSAGTGESAFLLVVVDSMQRIATGNSHSLMVRGDGTLWGSGWNTAGELGDGTKVIRSTPVRIAADVVSAAAGSQHSLYLKSDGSIWAMGSGAQGQLGDGTGYTQTTPVQIATGGLAITAGSYHSLFLKTDGTLWGVGANDRGQLGDGTDTRRLSPIQIASEVVAISAGGNQSFWIKGDGSLWATGENASGELGDGTKINRNVPIQIAQGVFSVSASSSHTLFVKTDGSLWGMGHNGEHQLGGGNPWNCVLPVKIQEGATAAQAGSSTTLYTTVDSRLWLLGARDGTTHSAALQLAEAVTAFDAGLRYLIFSTSDGKFWGEGSNRSRVMGDGSLFQRDVPVMIARDVATMGAGWSHSFYVKSDGSLWGFGANGSGGLGDGSSASRSVPVAIAANVLKASAGTNHSLFLKADGELWGMGLQTDGKRYDNPTRIAQQVTHAAAGNGFSHWIKSDGALWAEGQNYYGQLGDGTTTDRWNEVFVAENAASVVAGGSHALFRKTDGTLWGTGSNTYGQLGDGTTTSRASPVLIAADVSKAAASAYHSLFVKMDGTLWASGYNAYGQLGDGTRLMKTVPVQIASGIVDAAAGASASYFVTDEGYLWAAGRDYGTSPIRIARGVRSVASTGGHVLILKKDRTLWTMGENGDGELGDGAVLSYDSPVEIVLGRASVDSVVLPFEANAGETVTFSVTAVGEGAMSYQWRRDGVALEGATASSYSLSNVQGGDGGLYDVVITNALGSVVSAAGPLAILGEPPRIISATTLTAARFAPVSFSILATNEPTSFSATGLPEGLTLQTEDGLIAGIPVASAGTYGVTVGAANEHGSDTATLTITLSQANVPAITSSRTAVARRGTAFRMQITAAGSPESFGATGLPAGLAVDAATGLISGTPTAQPGIYSASLTATNEGGTGVLLVKFAVVSEGQDRAAGFQSTLFIDDAGRLWSAGENAFGQLGDGTAMHRSVPVPVAEDVATIATSPSNTLFVKKDGTLWGMGWNVEGMLGFGDTRERRAPELIRSDVIAVAAGLGHSVFLQSDGTAWGVGRNNQGQLGDGTKQNRLQPVMLASEVLSIGAGAECTYLVKADGTLWATGSNYSGELGDGTFEHRSSPVMVASDVSTVQGSLSLALFLKKDATLWGMGFNGGDQLRMREDSDDYNEPTPVKLADGVASFSAGANQILYITTSGTLWGRGLNWWGQLGDRTKLYETAPRQIAADVGLAFTGYNHSVFRKTDGSVWAMGTSVGGELADGRDSLQTIPAKVADNIVQSAAGDAHSLFLTNRGDLWAVGYNSLGSLGDGTDVDRGEPVKVAEDVSDVATSFWHSVFVKEDGSLWAMGNNGDGQLGTGGTNPNGINRPRRVMDDVKTAVTGAWHTVALKKDGTVWTIGWNGQGQLGDGTNVQRTTPVQVMSGVSEVAAGGKHTLFLKSDGTLWATGDNEAGQLGDGTTTNCNSPVQVMSGVTRIAAGGWHSLFLKTDGTLWGVGYNQFGQLGDGSSTDRLSPVLIDSNVRAMAAGTYHTQYIKEDGTLWATGLNDSGQLGDGVAAAGIKHARGADAAAAGDGFPLAPRVVRMETDQAATVVAPTGLGVRARLVAATVAQPPVEKGRHAAVGLAAGAYLQTEQPQTQYRPVRVATGVSHVATGGYHSLYRKHNGSLWAMGQAMHGRLGNGAGLVQWEPKEIKFGPPAILSQSIPSAVTLGQIVEFAVEAAGIGPFTYQWRKHGQAIPGATNARWMVNGVTAVDGAVYDVVVSNAFGSRACTAVNVSVTNAAPVLLGDLTASAQRLTDGFNFQLEANNDAISFAAEGLPPGLSLDSETGVISGRVDAPEGTVLVTVKATNAYGTSSGVLTIDVAPQAAPVITSSLTVLTRSGQALRYEIRTNSSATEYAAEDLPEGLTLDLSSGIITGTVSAAAGDRIATIRARNSAGWGSAEVTFAVLPVSAGISAGTGHSVVVDAQGVLWAMGSNQYGQLGDGTLIDRGLPRKAAEDVVAAQAGAERSVFLKSDGSLWAMGYDAGSVILSPVLLADGVRAFAAGRFHTAFIDSDFGLWTVGSNSHGQLGDGTTTDQKSAVQIASGVEQVAAGDDFTAFVKRDGTLWTVGRNNDGQLGDGTTSDRSIASKVVDDVRSVWAASSCLFFVKTDHTAWAAGNNWGGRLGDGTTTSRSIPVYIRSDVVQIDSGGRGSVWLTSDGEVWAVGDNGVTGWSGQQLKKVHSEIAAIATGGSHVLLVDRAGRVLALGANYSGQLGQSARETSLPAKIAADVLQVAGGSSHTMFVKQDGTLWGMGGSSGGERGPGSFTFGISPAQGISSVAQVAAGAAYTLYLKNDGTLWGMGQNNYGQIGAGTSSVYSPVQMASGVASAHAGAFQSFFVKADGTLWGTGYNGTRMIGDGTDVNRPAPVKIADGALTVTTGSSHTLFIKTDGSLWGHGSNWGDQLGSAAGTTAAVPVQITSGVAAAAGGSGSTLFLTAAGELWGLGDNTYGQLGDGTKLKRSTPVKIAVGVQSVSAADQSAYFCKFDGSLWAFGENRSRQLGDGTDIERLSPVLIATGVASVSASSRVVLYIKKDRTLWGAGTNDSGRLGLPFVQSLSEPTEIKLGAPVVDKLTMPPAANFGGSAQFSVEASGIGEMTYQWRKNGVPISGATGAGYFIGVVTAADGGIYDVVVTGSRGSVASNAGSFAVLNAPPVITSSLFVTTSSGVDFEYHVTASNDAYEFSAAGLPAGLEIDETSGRIFGTLQVPIGVYPVSLNASNAHGTAEATLELAIASALPVITTDPSDQSIIVGETASLNVVANGTPSPTLKWQVSTNGSTWSDVTDGALYSGATSESVSITGVTMAMNGYRYRAVATNSVGSVTSSAATLAVTGVAPSITTHPSSSTVTTGGDASFTVAASGAPAPSLRWQVSTNGITWSDATNNSTYSGVTANTLTITGATTEMNSYRYRAVAANSLGSATSNAAMLTVNGIPPSFTTHPSAQTVTTGGIASFTIAVSGTPMPTLRWQRSTDGATWTNINSSALYSGVTTDTLSITGVALSLNGLRYRVVASNSAGVATSDGAMLTVNGIPPTITTEPITQTVTAGAYFNFSVVVSGTPTPTVRWQLSTDGSTWNDIPEGSPYSDTTRDKLNISGATLAMNGYRYRAVATNSAGTVTSNTATLTVNGIAPSITTQPSGKTVTSGGNASFTAGVGGTPAPTLKWQVSTDGSTWSDVANAGVYSGATTNTLSITGATLAMNGYRFRAIATNSAGVATSTEAALGVNGIPPSITTHPSGRAVMIGSNASFAVAATGIPIPDLKWQVSTDAITWSDIGNSSPYDGVTSTLLRLSGVTLEMNGHRYRVVATNSAGGATSNAAILTVNGIAPTFTAYPSAQAVTVGADASFTVAADGAPLPALQWQVSTAGSDWSDLANGSPYAGTTTPTLSITGATLEMNNTRYRAVATNAVGMAVSVSATLIVNGIAPTIGMHPSAQTVTTGDNISFTVAASGTPMPTVKWQLSVNGSTWTDLADGGSHRGATTNTLNITGATVDLNGYQYRAVATNSAGSATSNTATLTVNGIAPSITTHPSGYTVTTGGGASFTVAASGTPIPTLRWQVSADGSTWNDIWDGGSYSGATSSTLSITDVVLSMNGYRYRAVATNSAGTATSNGVILTVNGIAPSITTQPAEQTVSAGDNVSFVVAVGGTPEPTLEWEVSIDGSTWADVPNGSPYIGEKSTGLAITNVPVSMNGYRYRAVATNIQGSATSDVARLTVNAPPPYFYGGVYFGEFANNRGHWAMEVNSDGSAVYIAYLSERKSAIHVRLTVAVDGSFSVFSTEIVPTIQPTVRALSNGATSKKTSALTNEFRLWGQIVDGSVTGELSGFETTFSGLVESGPGTAPAGFHISNSSTSSNAIYAVVAPSGRTLVVTVTPTAIDAASGIVSSDGHLTSSTVSGGQLTAIIGEEQVVASLTPVGSSTPISFGPTGGATHAIVDDGGYSAGGTITVTNTLVYTGSPTGLTWELLLPDGWSFVSSTAGVYATTVPAGGTTGTLEWAWGTPPPSPVTFSYVLSVPSTSVGAQEIAAIAGLQAAGTTVQILVKSDPLVIGERQSYHSADTNRDWKLSLLELARVIELYNTRDGATRSGAYAVLDGSEDGFAPEPARAANMSATLTRYHSADTDRNGRLSLLELARVIELYNQRTAGVRAGRYKLQSGSEDGYATEP